MKRNNIPATYGAFINYIHTNGNQTISGVGFGSDDLEEVKKQLKYHLLRIDHIGCITLEYEIVKECKHCNGTGKVRKGKRIVKTVNCPNCKGKPILEHVETWQDWRQSLNVKNVCTHKRIKKDWENNKLYVCPDCTFEWDSNNSGSLDMAMQEHWEKK